jgi:hypothetical protein
MVHTCKSKTLITDLYSMNPPDSTGYYFLASYNTKANFHFHHHVRLFHKREWLSADAVIFWFVFRGSILRFPTPIEWAVGTLIRTGHARTGKSSCHFKQFVQISNSTRLNLPEDIRNAKGIEQWGWCYNQEEN